MNSDTGISGTRREIPGPGGLYRVSVAIDRLLAVIGRIGSWFGVLIVFVVVYDVITRYFGLPRGFGINATQLQESEYWIHTILFSLLIGYAYTRQTHVRIDLFREKLSRRKKYWIEIIGTLFFVLPYCAIAFFYTFDYVQKSFEQGEFSKSVIGLTNIWILKSFLLVLFFLLALAAISQCIKCIYGLRGLLPEDVSRQTIGEDA